MSVRLHSSGRTRGPGGSGSPRWPGGDCSASGGDKARSWCAWAWRGWCCHQMWCEKPLGALGDLLHLLPGEEVGDRPRAPPLPPSPSWFELGRDQLTWDGKLVYLGRSHPLSLHDVPTLRCASWSREHAEVSRGNGVNVSRGRGRQVPSAPSSCAPAGRWWGASAWGWGSVPAGTPLCLASVSLSSAPPAAVDAGMILADSRGLCRRKRPRLWSRRAVFAGSVAEEDVGGAHFLLSPRQPGPAGVLRATRPQGPWGGHLSPASSGTTHRSPCRTPRFP